MPSGTRMAFQSCRKGEFNRVPFRGRSDVFARESPSRQTRLESMEALNSSPRAGSRFQAARAGPRSMACAEPAARASSPPSLRTICTRVPGLRNNPWRRRASRAARSAGSSNPPTAAGR